MLHLLPDIAKNTTPCILFLGAHSDDIEIGCGVTIARLGQEIADGQFSSINGLDPDEILMAYER